mmetsp:Transcript_13124/g.27758  ORF Transcript_13124/g.27758 Transcript_13124/m.27758 type:complete len:227 (+) Transcript_13124:41-721(+)
MISSIFVKVVISTLLASQVSAFATSPRHHGISIPASSTATAMAASNDLPPSSSRRQALSSLVSGLVATTTAATVATVWGGNAELANAEGSRIIGQISGSGLFFKDTLTVESFDDPKVKGVTLYVSNFERPLTERIQKDFFTEPSYASVTAVKTGPIEVADNINKDKGGEPVFEEKRSLLFKELRVQRIYDEEKKTLVYVSFNTRLDKNSDSNKSRFKSSISAISLE